MKAGIFFITVVFLAGFTAFAQIRNSTGDPDDMDAGVVPQQTKKVQQQEDQKQVLYQWIDGKGVVHITDDLNKVPMQYRSSARKLESAQEGEKSRSGPATQDPTRPFNSYQDKEEHDAEQKDEWLQRMRAAKRKLANAEMRYQELEKKRDAAIMKWGGPSSGRLEGREEAARLEDKMKQVQQEIDNARNDIDVRIPDEARKAGIPPGWLRE